MLLLLATLVGPIVFFLLTWVVATVYRLYFPERPLPFERSPIVLRERATAQGENVPVGVREIREDQRRNRRQKEAQAPYQYHAWGETGIPDEWHEDLWRRRN
jgi:hypothetical protein